MSLGRPARARRLLGRCPGAESTGLLVFSGQECCAPTPVDIEQSSSRRRRRVGGEMPVEGCWSRVARPIFGTCGRYVSGELCGSTRPRAPGPHHRSGDHRRVKPDSGRPRRRGGISHHLRTTHPAAGGGPGVDTTLGDLGGVTARCHVSFALHILGLPSRHERAGNPRRYAQKEATVSRRMYNATIELAERFDALAEADLDHRLDQLSGFIPRSAGGVSGGGSRSPSASWRTVPTRSVRWCAR